MNHQSTYGLVQRRGWDKRARWWDGGGLEKTLGWRGAERDWGGEDRMEEEICMSPFCACFSFTLMLRIWNETWASHLLSSIYLNIMLTFTHTFTAFLTSATMMEIWFLLFVPFEITTSDRTLIYSYDVMISPAHYDISLVKIMLFINVY